MQAKCIFWRGVKDYAGKLSVLTCEIAVLYVIANTLRLMTKVYRLGSAARGKYRACAGVQGMYWLSF